jgi:hypothetical protein
MLLNTILETIGNTPIVRCNRVGSELDCTLYAKCEFLNAGGSLKDRIGIRMIEEAEKSGKINLAILSLNLLQEIRESEWRSRQRSRDTSSSLQCRKK